MKDIKKVKQGKRNRQAGARFETRVRADLESKGFICSKWQNNVEFKKRITECICCVCGKKNSYYGGTCVCGNHGLPTFKRNIKGKCVPAKMGRFRTNQSGFPDFIAYKKEVKFDSSLCEKETIITFVEAKSNGYLKPEEKEKAQWYLDNNYCSKFLIAYKEKEGRKVVVKYKDFEEYVGK